MRVHVDEKIVQKKTTAAQRASLVGIAVLVAAVVVSFRSSIPYYIAIAYSLSLVGLFVVSWSSVTANKWMGDLRGDKVLSKALKGLGGDYSLYNYLSPVDHVLLSWSGLTVLTLKRVEGPISCRGDSWRRPWSLSRVARALGEDRLGNPTRQAEAQVRVLQGWVKGQVPDAEVPIDSVIVFINPKAELAASEPAIPAVLVADLKDQLRARPAGKKMAPQVFKALTKLMDDYAA